MFEGLKKKLSNVIKSFSKKEEEELGENAEEAKPPQLGQRTEAAPRQPQMHEDKQKPAEPQAKHREEAKPAPTAKRGEPVRQRLRPPEKPLINLSVTTKIKGAILHKVKLNDSEIGSFTEMLRISMLESDVAYSTTEEFLESLKRELESSSIDSKHIQGELVRKVKGSLMEVVAKTLPKVEIVKFVEQRVAAKQLPVKILFLGPNGTGKTTTIGKIAYMLKSGGISAALSASDTFRAAAIEQTEHHANALHVPVIRSSYGADPASVAFDAIAYARAHAIDAVLIDSAGRQETNKNLINEIQKMERVVKPDLAIYVGESTAGNVIAEQISEFKKFIRIDGIILTKLDCDAKGGNAISIANVTGIPILFLGTGEKYTDIIPYDPKIIIDAILPEESSAE